MICNCNNSNNNGSSERPKIKHVYGNVLKMAIPLTLRTIELVETEVDGEVVQEAVATDTDFIPSDKYPVIITLSKFGVKLPIRAIMRDGNIAYFEDDGTIEIGTYDITVTCKDDNGKPYRFNQKTALQVVSATEDAGIKTPIEYEITTWYLDAAIFMAIKGEDGVGIEDIETISSGEIGGVNTITITLTDGRTRSFTILNGSGTVDDVFNINSPSPISNRAVTTKFNSLDSQIADLFGDADYNSTNKTIQFWNKGRTKILATIDARPFIKDGMVNSVYISNNTLVITFNTDSGREAIGVPLSSVFNPNNYYNKTQIDNRFSSITSLLISDYVAKVNLFARDNNVSTDVMPHFVLYSMGEPYDEGDDSPVADKNPFFYNGYISVFNGSMQMLTIGQPSTKVVYCNAKTNKLYRWDGSNFILVGGDEKVVFGGFISDSKFVVKKFDNSTSEWVNVRWAEHDPYSIYVDVTTNKTYRFDGNYGYVMIGGGSGGGSFEQVQADWNQSDSTSVDYIKNKPTIPTIPTNVSAFTNDAGYLTQHQDISGKVDKVAGKGLSTNDYTTAEKTKLAGLSNYDDTQIQAAVDALQSAIDALTGVNDTTEAINTMNEVIDFLDGVTNDETLTGKLNELRTLINGKSTITGITTNQDGTFTITLSNGDSYTVNLNHTHPQYQPLLTAGANITIAVNQQTGDLEISASGGGGNGISGITMNNSDVPVNNGVANLGTVITSHQSLSGYAKYVLLADEAAYNALATKDSSTLYLIPEQ